MTNTTDEANEMMNEVTSNADGQTFHVVAKPHPFDCETVICQFRHGLTIAEALGEHASHSAQVILGGVEVPRELWSKVRPRIGMPVEVILYPQGGNGGKVLRIVAIVALMYLTAGASAGLFATAGGMFAAGSTSAAVLAAGISIVGSMAINALIPPPSPKMSAQQDPFQQLASITGTSNQATPYGVIPCVVGTVRFMQVPALKDGEESNLDGRRFWRPVTVAGEVPRDVAVHEAGHAIAAWWTGKGLVQVHAGETGEGGFTESARCYIEGTDETSVNAFCKALTRKQLNDCVLRELVQAMAGPMAEARLKGYGLSWQAMLFDPGYREWQAGDPPSDLHAWSATSLLPKPKDRPRVANGSVSLCAAMLALYWPQVETLADALQVHRTLTGEQVLEVIGQMERAALCPLTLGQVEITA
jgi:hypothetical protein